MMATRVIRMLMEIIIASTPARVATEVMIWVRLWFKVWLTVSTSLVMRDSTSPWVLVS